MITLQLIIFCLIPFIALFIFAFIFDRGAKYITKKFNEINN
jgi:hypothetical protein